MRCVPIAAAAILMTAALCLFALPNEESDAVDPGDFRISIPEWPGSAGINHVEIEAGGSAIFTVYIENDIEHPLDMTFNTYSEAKFVTGSDHMHVTVPAAKDGIPAKVMDEYTITIEESAPARDNIEVVLSIIVTDLSDDTVILDNIRFDVTTYIEFGEGDVYNKYLGIFPNELRGILESPVFPAALTLIAIALSGLALGYAVYWVLIEKREIVISDARKRVLKRSIPLAVCTLGSLSSIGLCLEIAGCDPDLMYGARRLCNILFVTMSCFVIWRVYNAAVRSSLIKIGTDPLSVDALMPLFSAIAKLVLWTGGIALILAISGRDVLAIVAGGGFVALGIAICAKDLLAQAFGGAAILLTRRYREGSYVQVGEKVYIVKKIKLMYSEFWGTKRDRIFIVPNNKLESLTYINSDVERDSCRTRVEFSVPYGTDIKYVEKTLLKFAEELPGADPDAEMAPDVELLDFEESGILMSFSVTTLFRMNEKKIRKLLYAAMEENGIEMPYNKMDIEFKEGNGSFDG